LILWHVAQTLAHPLRPLTPMTEAKPYREFLVINWVRQAWWILVVAELVLLVFVFCPIDWLAVACMALVGAVFALVLVDKLALNRRISLRVISFLSNRIQFNSDGIELLSDRFGDQWERPHEEFLIEFRTSRCWFAFGHYELRLRHKVLGKFRIFGSNDGKLTNELFRSLATQYPVKAYRSSKSAVD
jgi:hypothetical protein